MIDFMQQHLGAVARLANFAFDAVALLLKPRLFQRLVDRGAEQLEKVVAGRLENVVAGAGLERRDRDGGVGLRRAVVRLRPVPGRNNLACPRLFCIVAIVTAARVLFHGADT